VLAFFWWFFWFRLKIVGFEPNSDNSDKQPAQTGPRAPALWPVTVLFLFDRLIPIYKIRDEHYAIDNFYRKASAKEIAKASGPPTDPPYALTYLRRKYLVCRLLLEKKQNLDKFVAITLAIGAGFTFILLTAP